MLNGWKKNQNNILAGFLVVLFFSCLIFIPIFKANAYVDTAISGLSQTGYGEWSLEVASGDPAYPVVCPPTASMGPAKASDIQALIDCVKETADSNDQLVRADTMKQLLALQAKRRREELWEMIKEKAKDVLAVSFRNSLKSFSRQIAHDTAVWVASGGKGQKPLFITEGWGAYLQNAADSALGDFIDNIGQQYNVSLCEPGNINIRIAIETGINWQQPRQVRCTFSQMMNNWEKAISDPNFSFEYTNSMRPGENDVSVFLQLQSNAFTTVARKIDLAEKEAGTDSLFKPIKELAGKILTPGTAVKDAFLAAVNPASKNASFGYDVFTGTIADIIEEFLNTLVSQLLKNLQSGLFSSSGSSNNNESGFSLPDLSSLFNFSASPRTYEGAVGAQNRLRNLVESKIKIGGPYDILTKLMLCTDQSKNNLGPTDCVIDPILSEAIRQKTQIKDLPKEVLDRVFAPPINEVTNPQVAFTERNIKILRKYRILPVGWEVAAEIIKNNKSRKTFTLGDVMSDPELKKYIDPYWVLEAPELFCRQLGYGAHNSTANSQDGSITRDEYCADEQQCIQTNDSGNCSAYGYCTEERRYWDFGSKTCQPKYNTCETFADRGGQKNSWLVNSLDFRNCDENNFGCRWFSASYNTVDSFWEHLAPEETMTKCNSVGGCNNPIGSPSPVIKQGHIMTDDRRVIMGQPCSAEACSNENLINNGGFENGLAGFDVLPGMDATITTTTVKGGKQAIRLYNSAAPNKDITVNDSITFFKDKKYIVSAYVYIVTSGNVYLDISDTVVSGVGVHDQWVRIYYTTTTNDTIAATARLVVGDGVTVYLDDFQVQEVGKGRCIYSEESKSCSFYQGNCTTTFGGVMCSVDNCQIGNNLLAGLNSGFEDAVTGMDFRPDKWNSENSYYNLDNRLYREAKKDVGGYDLAIKANNNPSTLSVRLDNIQVTPGKRYALKFNLREDYITAGGLSVGIYEKNNEQPINGLSFIALPVSWQDYSFEFDVPAAATNTYINIKVPARSQALMYADDFELKEVDKTCNANSIWLTQGTTATNNKEIYFNAKVPACNGAADGCNQFIRTKAGLGSNLIVNGSFNAATSGWEFLSTHFTYINDDKGSYAKVDDNSESYDKFKVMDIMPGNYYIISFDAAQINSGDANKARFEMFLATNTTSLIPPLPGPPNPQGIPVLITDCKQTGDRTITLENTPTDVAFERKSCKFLAPEGAYALRYKIFAEANELYVDNIKLEPVFYNIDSPSDYTDYNPNTRPANQVAYLKKAPDFFNCYRTSTAPYGWADSSTLWSILASQQPVCQGYAPVCTRDEVGCELYTPVNGDPVVPGIVDALDLCPFECSGYSVYRQEPTSFVSSKYRQFIADKNLKYCPAAYAGCDEFTNLDRLGQGAEAREYYVSFRACQKTEVAGGGTYYTWEGSETLGYQLKIYRLKQSTTTVYAPCTYITYDGNGNSSCADNNTSGTPGHAGYCSRDEMFINPDCREFFSANTGSSTYRLLSKTISVSDDCHPYRRTQTQTSDTETRGDCNVNQGYWNASSSCIYMAIPQEGRTCPSSVMGCREFTGNRANNVRNLINSNFGTDSVSTSSWQDASGNTTGLQISTESSFVGGYSITNVSANLVMKHPVAIAQGRAYTLSFWAKRGKTMTSNVVIGDATGASGIKFTSINGLANYFSLTSSTNGNLANSGRVEITADWNKYDLGPVFVTSTPTDNEYLEFILPTSPANSVIYLDNVILKEVREDIFAVDNSWFTPLACDNKLGDVDGQKAIDSHSCTSTVGSIKGTRCFPGEMIGCAAYKDRAGTVNYFKSFAKLCRQEAAGCEALIDTYNYAPAEGKVFNDGDKSSTTVKADEMIYLVNDRKYACRDSEKGCTAYGLPMITQYEEVAGFNTVYLLNNPDVYNRTLCKFNEVWCDQYVGQSSVRYFKNPHGRVCQYEIKTGQIEGDWYIAGTDEPCTTTADQTLGTGYGKPSDKYQPIGLVDNATGEDNTGYDNWVGACPAFQSGCSEIIDPLPYIYTPLKIENDKVMVKINTLYGYINSNLLSLVDDRGGIAAIRYPDQSQTSTLKRFYVSCSKDDSRCGNEDIEINIDDTARLSKSGVYYAFENALDRRSCNGLVDYDSGCVLINNRASMDYASNTAWTDRVTKYLSYDAYATYLRNRSITFNGIEEIAGKIEAVAPQSGQNDSNLVVKVKPARTCNSWLSCTTYEKKDQGSSNQFFSAQDKCLGVGLCDSFNDQMICDHFIVSTPTSTFNSLRDANKTGYSYLGQDVQNPGYYSYELMTQEGEAANVVNGNFEVGYSSAANSTQRQVGEITQSVKVMTPMGWQPGIYNCPNSDCTGGWPKVKVSNATGREISLNTEKSIAKEGSGSLMIYSGNAAISEYIELENDTDYFLSAWVRTKDLAGSNDLDAPARAEIQLRFFNATGTIITDIDTVSTAWSVGYSPVDAENIDGGWLYVSSNPSPLHIEHGLDWTHVIFRFHTGLDVYRTQLALMNMNPIPPPSSGYDNVSNFGGYTLWDDIQIKPMLKANDTERINRTCRVYPDQSAPSCKYVSGNNSYYGTYGYCLLVDPANPEQCLQWWPVDNIKGEIADDFSPYYQERAPLYYCVSKATRKFNFLSANVIMSASDKIPEEYSGLLDDKGNEIIFTPFSVPPTSRPLFRYPFIYKIPVKVAAVGVGMDKGIYGTVFWGDMYPKRFCPLSLGGFISNALLGGRELCFSASKERPDPSETITDDVTSTDDAEDCDGWLCQLGATLMGIFENVAETITEAFNFVVNMFKDIADKILNLFQILPEDEWGGFGIIPLGSPGAGIAIPFPVPWHVALQLKGGVSGILGGLNEIMDSGMGGGVIGVRIVTDANMTGADTSDPVPSMKGDILGYLSFMSAAGVFGAGSPIIIGTTYRMEYCDRLVQVVNSSGQNKAWATRLTPASTYESQDSDCVRDEVQPTGTGRGPDHCFYASNYCVLKDCVLNKDKICDFCENFVGYLDGGSLKDLDDNPLDSVVCTDFSGGFTVGDPQDGNDKGDIFKLLRNSNECKDYFAFRYNNVIGILAGLFGWDTYYVYKRVYSENNFGYDADYRPFGSVVAPNNGQYPSEWDSRPEVAGYQPLYYELPNTGLAAPYQARSGQLHYALDDPDNDRKGNLKRLFAQSYSAWVYSANAGRYVQTSSISGLSWPLPGYCPGLERPAWPDDFCRVRPLINNVKVHLLNDVSHSSDTPLVVKIAFNISVDPDQVPIRSYAVDWDDGTRTSYSGVSLLARPASSTPFILYHYYDRRNLSSDNVTIAIKVKDNWNAVNGVGFNFTISDLTTNGASNAIQVCSCMEAPLCDLLLCRSLVGGDLLMPDPDAEEEEKEVKNGDLISIKYGDPSGVALTVDGNDDFTQSCNGKIIQFPWDEDTYQERDIDLKTFDSINSVFTIIGGSSCQFSGSNDCAQLQSKRQFDEGYLNNMVTCYDGACDSGEIIGVGDKGECPGGDLSDNNFTFHFEKIDTGPDNKLRYGDRVHIVTNGLSLSGDLELGASSAVFYVCRGNGDCD